MIPRLLHPATIELEQAASAQTVYHEDAREPIGTIARDDVKTIQGQVKWGTTKGLGMSAPGPEENAAGYVLFRKVDLDAQSITLAINDRIKKMGHVNTDVYVIRLEWIGHYTDQSGPTMVKAWFEDRSQAREIG